MKSAVQKSVQGWATRFGVIAVGAACYVGVLNPTTATAGGAPVTQLKYLQTLATLTGDSLPSGATPNDYVQWAKNKNMNLNWNAKAKISSDMVAQSLVQLLGLNPRKYGGDYKKNLEREGIIIPAGSTISNEQLAELVDNPLVAQKAVAVSSTSPVKPGNGNGNGYGWYEHQAGIPKPPPPRGRGNLPKPPR